MKKLLAAIAAAVTLAAPVALIGGSDASASTISHNATYGVDHNTFEFGYSYNSATGTLISVPQEVVTYLPTDAWIMQVCTDFTCTGTVGPFELGPGDGFYEPWIENWIDQAVPGNIINYKFCRYADQCWMWNVTLLNKLNDN